MTPWRRVHGGCAPGVQLAIGPWGKRREPQQLWVLLGFIVATGCQPREEVCNWLDDDEDGRVDEGFDADEDQVSSCGATEGDFALDLFDCDDAHADVYPGAAEECDGVDNDCDGAEDESCDPSALTFDGTFKRLITPTWDGVYGLAVLSESDGSPLLSFATNDGAGVLTPHASTPVEGIASIADLIPFTQGTASAPDYLAVNQFAIVHLVTQDSGAVAFSPDPFYIEVGTVTDHALWYRPRLVSSDINQDGASDTVVTGLANSSSGNLATDIFLAGPENLTLGASLPWAMSTEEATAVESPDLNGDSWPDLVVASGDTIAWRLGSAEGWSEVETLSTLDRTGDLVAEDLDRDGRRDLVFTTPLRWKVFVTFNTNLSPLFNVATEIDTPLRSPSWITSIDFDRDGDPDLVVAGPQDSLLVVLENDGTATFSLACEVPLGTGSLALAPLKLRPGATSAIAVALEGGSVVVLEELCP